MNGVPDARGGPCVHRLVHRPRQPWTSSTGRMNVIASVEPGDRAATWGSVA